MTAGPEGQPPPTARPPGELARGASSRALFGTIVGSAPGFLLPFAVVAHIGAGATTDAYFFALALSLFATSVLDVTLQANALPVLEGQKARGTEEYLRNVRRIAAQAQAVAAGIYFLVGAVGAFFVLERFAWSTDQQQTSLLALVALAPLVLAVAASSILSAALYSMGDFLRPTSTLALRSVTPLLVLPLLGTGAGAVGALAALMAAGEILRALYLRAHVRARAQALVPGVIVPRASMWRHSVPHGASMLIANINPLVGKAAAGSLGAGSVTLLELGERIMYAPVMALTAWYVLVAGARWSRQGTRDIAGLRADFQRTLVRAVLLAAGTAVLVVAGLAVAVQVAGPEIVAVSTTRFLELTAVLLVGLPAAIVTNLAARLLTSIQRTALLPAIAAVSVVLQVAAVLIGASALGLLGVVIAISAIRWIDALMLVWACWAAMNDTGDELTGEATRA